MDAVRSTTELRDEGTAGRVGGCIAEVVVEAGIDEVFRGTEAAERAAAPVGCVAADNFVSKSNLIWETTLSDNIPDAPALSHGFGGDGEAIQNPFNDPYRCTSICPF